MPGTDLSASSTIGESLKCDQYDCVSPGALDLESRPLASKAVFQRTASKIRTIEGPGAHPPTGSQHCSPALPETQSSYYGHLTRSGRAL